MRVAIALAAGVLVTLLLATHGADTLELPARDLALRVLPERPATRTAVVAIDERSLQARGPWPWPRADLAKIVDACAAAGARAVVFDILLSDPREGDELLAASMRRLPTAAVSVLVENEQWLIPAKARSPSVAPGFCPGNAWGVQGLRPRRRPLQSACCGARLRGRETRLHRPTRAQARGHTWTARLRAQPPRPPESK